jgi:hypothetical protein
MNRTRMINTNTVYLMIVAVLATSLSTVVNGALFASPESDGSSSNVEDDSNGGSGDQSTEPEPEQPDPEPVPEPEPETVPESIPGSLPESEPEPEPLPYCDTPEGKEAPACHDRYDYDEITGSYPCNDGSQVPDPLDCTASTPEPEPLPYCDTPEGKEAPACHDRYDYDEITGLYPCNDGSQVPDPLDCTASTPVPPGPPDGDCLFDTSLPQCVPLPGETDCPEGFGTNKDGRCFPLHPNGCPEGYHSHEDDESGECIADSTPCDPGYVINPDYPECGKKERICTEHPEAKVCGGKGGHNGNGDDDNDDDIIIKIRNNINNINVIKTIIKNDPTAFEVDLVAMGINSDGTAIKCLMDVNRAEADCEKFGVPADRVSGTITEFIEYESGAKDRAEQNSYLNSLMQNINDIDFIENNVDNKDLGVDIAATGINQDGKGMECLINVDKEKAECEEFTVTLDRISGQITEIVEFD